MSYALIIPPEYLAKLVLFRQWFKRSIGSQVLQAIERFTEDLGTG
ncbi:MAG: hypothetical protein WBB67_12000 [bacterium]